MNFTSAATYGPLPPSAFAWAAGDSRGSSASGDRRTALVHPARPRATRRTAAPSDRYELFTPWLRGTWWGATAWADRTSWSVGGAAVTQKTYCPADLLVRRRGPVSSWPRSEEHTSELQSRL